VIQVASGPEKVPASQGAGSVAQELPFWSRGSKGSSHVAGLLGMPFPMG